MAIGEPSQEQTGSTADEGPRYADACKQMGVSSYSFQQKFGISGIDVKLLANRGMLKITGKERFSVHGEPHYAPLYSVMQIYLLTPETVQEWLEDLRNVG